MTESIIAKIRDCPRCGGVGGLILVHSPTETHCIFCGHTLYNDGVAVKTRESELNVAPEIAALVGEWARAAGIEWDDGEAAPEPPADDFATRWALAFDRAAEDYTTLVG